MKKITLAVLLVSSCITLKAGNKDLRVHGIDDQFDAYDTSKKKNPINDGVNQALAIAAEKIHELKEGSHNSGNTTETHELKTDTSTTNNQNTMTTNDTNQSTATGTQNGAIGNNTSEQSVVNTKGTKIFDFVKINKTEIAAGLVAVVVIGGTLYVLYKNGTLKKLSDWVQENPKQAAQLCVVVAGVVAIGAALKHYGLPTVKNPFVRA